MFTLPSPRRLLLPTLSLLVVLFLLRLLSSTSLFNTSQHALFHAALQRHLSGGHAKITVLNVSSHPRLFEGGRDGIYEESWRKKPIPKANVLIRRFAECAVPSYAAFTAVLAGSYQARRNLCRRWRGEPKLTAKQGRADEIFNPAIIPLPYWSHPARYILVSRVVTSGFHQESHVCLADICLPQPPSSSSSSQPQSHLPPDTRPCTSSDHAFLGLPGGLRCLTPPLKINIPPTPAEKCEGAWLAFPDIPGFHDPRVFWSGKGEPLILVNSASRYGCVGLWIVDLRVVYPMLEGLLSRESARGSIAGVMRRGAGKEGREEVISLKGLGGKPSMSYPHLTELTRNPRSSRASVEKNWVLWFPNGEDAYVQYDLLGHRVLSEDIVEHGMVQDQEALARLGLGGNLTQAYGYANVTKATTPGMNATMLPGMDKRRSIQSSRRGGRTFAKITGNGFTTRNLTHPEEPTCFPAAEELFRDSLGNMGHWHQGSNSLRLILCTRAQARTDPACKHDEYADIDKDRTEPVGAVESGRSVHFAIMHRKFSNEWELPLRYERYVVVWEGREPFQILGVSRHPLLFRDEWAKPWTREENWPGTKGEGWNATRSPVDEEKIEVVRRGGPNKAQENVGGEDFDKDSAYFTYTPSLAWTWRPHSAAANQEEEEDDADYMSQLGTGYLGEDVLVGIGLDDVRQAFARVKVDDLLQCLRLCPGVTFTEEEAD